MKIKGNPFYALEKFSEAVRILAIGEGDVRSRLNSAFLVFHPVAERDLPPELVDDWKWIMHQLTRFPSQRGGCDTVERTLRKIQNRTGKKIAERIVYLCHRLESHVESVAE